MSSAKISAADAASRISSLAGGLYDKPLLAAVLLLSAHVAQSDPALVLSILDRAIADQRGRRNSGEPSALLGQARNIVNMVST